MGCDIHLHTEVKIKGRWHHYTEPDTNRNYALFARMAGVRGEETPIAEPRGIPADISEPTRIDYLKWEGDGHSHSWLNAEEIATLEEWTQNSLTHERWSPEFGYLFGVNWSDFTKARQYIPKEIEDIRFVFWFDN